MANIQGNFDDYYNWNTLLNNTPDKPEEDKQYLLLSSSEQPSIANGNTWAESEIKEASYGTVQRTTH